MVNVGTNSIHGASGLITMSSTCAAKYLQAHETQLMTVQLKGQSFSEQKPHCFTKWVTNGLMSDEMETAYIYKPPIFFRNVGFWSKKHEIVRKNTLDNTSYRRCEPDNHPLQTLVGKVHLSEMTAASLQPSVWGLGRR